MSFNKVSSFSIVIHPFYLSFLCLDKASIIRSTRKSWWGTTQRWEEFSYSPDINLSLLFHHYTKGSIWKELRFMFLHHLCDPFWSTYPCSFWLPIPFQYIQSQFLVYLGPKIWWQTIRWTSTLPFATKNI